MEILRYDYYVGVPPMPLLLPPSIYAELHTLATEYNAVSEDDVIQKIFYLQKINYVINETNLNKVLTADPSQKPNTNSINTYSNNIKLFDWLTTADDDGWQKHLLAHSISPNASFFLKGIQFAEAVAKQIKDKQEPDNIPTAEKDQYPEFPLLQLRDNLLAKQTFSTCKEQYKKLCSQLNELRHNFPRINEKIEAHLAILNVTAPKIESIQSKKTTGSRTSKRFTTKKLTERGNNANFVLTINGKERSIDDKEGAAPGKEEESFIIRVEDRPSLGLEQKLHSHPVAQYFTDEYSHFMMIFKHTIPPIVFKPVVLSQYANQADLTNVTKLIKTKPKLIASKAKYLFVELSDYCIKLMAAGAYDPDIKLSNFLVHNNKVLKSDRKTLISNENPKVNEIRATQFFSPKEVNDQFNQNPINMPQLMAFQLGVALKQFLILTQTETTQPNLRKAYPNAASYFKSPNNGIHNLSLLAQELTREDATKRLSIKQFHYLLKFYNQSPDNFYQILEKVFPSLNLGIQQELDNITILLNSNLKGMELITQANLIFNKISANDPQEPRLVRMAEKLAHKCAQEYRYAFAQYFDKFANILFNSDWNVASWGRKAIHTLTFGYFRVDRQIREANFNWNAESTPVNISKLMAYQLGMALKEFLIVTRFNKLPEQFKTTEHATASYFKSSKNEIANFSLLVQELTHKDQNQRMSIEQFQNLLPFLDNSPDEFYKEMEKILPSSALRIQDQLIEITRLLESNLTGVQLIEQANLIFSKISNFDSKEIYLIRMAEKLAFKCIQEYSSAFFVQGSNSIETQLLNKDWEAADWHRKALHWLSLGYFRVDRVIDEQFKTKEFQQQLPLLEFIPQHVLKKYLGEEQAINLETFIFINQNELSTQNEEIEEEEEDEEITSSNSIINALSSQESSPDYISPESLSDRASPQTSLSKDKTSSEVFSSVIIHPVPSKKNTASHGFFIKPPTPSDEPVHLISTPISQAALKGTKTIGSTIVQGDTILRPGALAAIKWNPPGNTPQP